MTIKQIALVATVAACSVAAHAQVAEKASVSVGFNKEYSQKVSGVTPTPAPPPSMEAEAENQLRPFSGKRKTTVPAPAPTEAPTEPPAPAPAPAPAPVPKAWMHSDVGAAWSQGFTGKGVTVHVSDDHADTSTKFNGNMSGTVENGTHGFWTAMQVGLVAPDAVVVKHDYRNNSAALPLASSGLNVVNASYGMMAAAGYSLSQVILPALETSIIDYAKTGKAVVVKSAGNDSVAIGAATSDGRTDYFAPHFATATSGILVGALEKNGSTSSPAKIASYSNVAGNDVNIQNRFVTVGVDSSTMGLAGTSFAAPIVSGYAAILGSKFTSATPVQVTNQLLNTARTDTILNYNPTVHGRGEASLSRALAPVALQ